MNNVIAQVVSKDLCSGCGVCAGLCPTDALFMGLQTNGDLTPHIHADLCLERCNHCLVVCPFQEYVYNPRRLNTEIFGRKSGAKYIEDIGWFTDSIVGFRQNEALRKTSASGGLAIWFLETLLQNGLITRAAVVRFAPNHEKGFFEFAAVSTVEELRKSSGSIYQPVEISDVIKTVLSNNNESWAIVGVPCLCTAIRNSKRLRKNVPYVLGLACGMYQNVFYTEMLLAKSKRNRERVVNIEYRIKSEDGPSNDFRFCGTDNNGRGEAIPYHKLPYYLGKNAYFRLNACNFCMDVFSETAEACFMDAWLPEYINESQGVSLVVIRDSSLKNLFIEGMNNGDIWIEDINPEKIVASQRGHVHRKRELVYMRSGMYLPKDATAAKPKIFEKLSWILQRWTLKRSKIAWAKYGRKYGIFGFWMVMIDLLLLQKILELILWMSSLPNRIVGKTKRYLIKS